MRLDGESSAIGPLAGDSTVIEAPPPGSLVEQALSPVRYPAAFAEEDRRPPEDGMALCLSGGGYRAMLFHLGTLWRLNELSYLPRFKRISSVSGGSITAALLGLKWRRLIWSRLSATNFIAEVVAPIRSLAGRTIDVPSILRGALPFTSINDRVQVAYRKHLFGDATLQNLPDESIGAPRFVINATNVQTGAIWRFSRPYMADWRVGQVDKPRISLALAVAASSAFPPLLSPAKMKLDKGLMKSLKGADLHLEPYTTKVVLSDGGVYDNLGLETVWKRYRTILVSDGGGQMKPDASPARDWIFHGLRTTELIDNQVRSLRKRQVVGSFQLFEGGDPQIVRRGAYWRIGGKIARYPAPDTLACPYAQTVELARTPTRLKGLEEVLQQRLINWGYALCDAAVRSWLDDAKQKPAPERFPYPQAGVGVGDEEDFH